MAFFGNDLGDKTGCRQIWVDMVEVNHVHDSRGTLSFTQIVAWRIEPETGRPITVGWMLTDRGAFYIRPILRPSGTWAITVQSESGMMLTVLARTHRESWTQHDIEMEDRRRRRIMHDPVNVFTTPSSTRTPRATIDDDLP
jgi:hypothetical protein